MIALIQPPNRSQPEFPNALNAPTGFCPSCGQWMFPQRSSYSRTSSPEGCRPAGKSRRRISQPDMESARCFQGRRMPPQPTGQIRFSRKMCFLYALFDSFFFSNPLRSAQLSQCITEVCKKQSPPGKHTFFPYLHIYGCPCTSCHRKSCSFKLCIFRFLRNIYCLSIIFN